MKKQLKLRKITEISLEPSKWPKPLRIFFFPGSCFFVFFFSFRFGLFVYISFFFFFFFFSRFGLFVYYSLLFSFFFGFGLFVYFSLIFIYFSCLGFFLILLLLFFWVWIFCWCPISNPIKLNLIGSNWVSTHLPIY